MLSKVGFEMPYFTPFPLSEKTEWVAYPVLVSCKSKEYAAALTRAKEINAELNNMSGELVNDKCEILQSLSGEGLEDMQTAIEFSKQGNDLIANVYQYIVVKFKDELPFWEKMDIVSCYLDGINGFSDKFKSEKNTVVTPGIRFDARKKYV